PILENGSQTGKYQAHLVLPGDTTLPPLVHVVNSTSNPVLATAAALSDIVHISKADYNPSNGDLCVSAHSSDDAMLTLTADSTPVTTQLDATPKTGCPATIANELTALVQFPLNRAPDKVRVISGLLGAAEKQVTVLANTPDNTATLIANGDTFLNIPGAGPQVLDVGANDGPNGTGGQAGEIVIVDQPSISSVDANGQTTTEVVGTITGSLTGGTATLTANSGAAGVATFTYLVRNADNVSNLATATVDIQFVAAPPTGNADNFAVLRTNNTTGFTAKVLQNDVAAVGTTIDPATVVIGTQGTRGVATANADGTVTYKPNVGATAGNDAFFYTVKNTAGNESSATRVDVVVENSAESVSIQRNKYTGRWDLRFSTSWFGAPLTSTGSCWLVRVANTNIATPRRIGTVSVDATGSVQMQPQGTKLYNAANYDPAVDVPLLPAKTNYTIRCGTSNLVTPLPTASASTADNTTTSP
ncbi:MAG: Ig-like domain-containing protein, partial [Methylobacter sp.]